MQNPDLKRSLPNVPEMADDFRLEPVAPTPENMTVHVNSLETRRQTGSRGSKASRYRKNPHAAIHTAEPFESRREFIREASSSSDTLTQEDILLSDKVDYASIKTLQKVLRIIGYFVPLVIAMLLVFRFLQIMFFAGYPSPPSFASLLVDAFWLGLGATFVSGTLFAFAEFLQLMIDIRSNFQADTLAIPGDTSARPDVPPETGRDT